MTAAALISLRETLETSLVVGLMLSFLNRSGHTSEKRFVWCGVALGAGVSLLLAVIFQTIARDLNEAAREVYEAVMMLGAAGLLTWMLFWMMKTGSEHRRMIEKNMTQHVQNQHWLGILLLSMMTTAREGTEMVIFLNASMLSAGSHAHELAGALLGITGALILSYLVFKGTQIISLKVFFTVTTALLILFGAGLMMHGIGALQEAHLLPFFDQTAWNTGTYLSQEHGFGSVLEGLFGYEEAPSVLQVGSYVLYLIGSLLLWRKLIK